jgi:predicted MFS family arabinose efflux permease
VAGCWFADDERGQMRLTAAMIALLVPCFVMFLLLPNKHHALIALIPLMVAFNFFLGPSFALMQRLVVDEIRATTLAIVMLLANLIGMGIGPQIVGILSDALMPRWGSDSLRYAMLAMSFVALWAAYHFWQVGRTVKDDLAAATDVAPA